MEIGGGAILTQEEKHASGRSLSGLLIDPFKQIKFGVYVMLLSLTFICCSGLLFWSAFMEQYAQLAEIFGVVDQGALWELQFNDVFKTNVYKIFGFFILFLMLTYGTVFKLTHRYYGPLVAIYRFLDQLQQGNYTARVTIRKGDELGELVQRLNHLAEKLEHANSSK